MNSHPRPNDRGVNTFHGWLQLASNRRLLETGGRDAVHRKTDLGGLCKGTRNQLTRLNRMGLGVTVGLRCRIPRKTRRAMRGHRRRTAHRRNLRWFLPVPVPVPVPSLRRNAKLPSMPARSPALIEFRRRPSVAYWCYPVAYLNRKSEIVARLYRICRSLARS